MFLVFYSYQKFQKPINKLIFHFQLKNLLFFLYNTTPCIDRAVLCEKTLCQLISFVRTYDYNTKSKASSYSRSTHHYVNLLRHIDNNNYQLIQTSLRSRHFFCFLSNFYSTINSSPHTLTSCFYLLFQNVPKKVINRFSWRMKVRNYHYYINHTVSLVCPPRQGNVLN